MKTVKALVLSGFGLNCDYETAHVLQLAGARATRVHINDLTGTPARPAREILLNYSIIVFDGGFSWGDDHGAGVLLATRVARHLGDNLHDFMEQGGLIMGICNGFQALVNLGVLPGCDGQIARQVALMHNDCGNFQNRWIETAVDCQSPCLFTKGISGLTMPIRHGEGKLVADPKVLEQISRQHLAPLRYSGPDGAPAKGVFPYNPNGSMLDIAGLCSPDGRVFGLMPHPEAYYRQNQHPDYTFWREKARRQGLSIEPAGAGLLIFANAVKAAKEIL
jgi:phosphoribosylformylglycinamidine synthase